MGRNQEGEAGMVPLSITPNDPLGDVCFLFLRLKVLVSSGYIMLPEGTRVTLSISWDYLQSPWDSSASNQGSQFRVGVIATDQQEEVRLLLHSEAGRTMGRAQAIHLDIS